MPTDMNGSAQAAWRHVRRELRGSGLLTGADAHLLRLYCEAFARYLAASEMYAKTTPLVNERGHLAKNPLHQVVRDNADQVRVLARELGLSPVARAGLSIMPGADMPDIDADIGPPPRLRLVADDG
jgi:P27 family predicted phage terminase small subunit